MRRMLPTTSTTGWYLVRKSDFPKLFAKTGGKRWKGGEIAKTLSEYLKILGFGRNAAKAYGRTEDNPSWWPKKPIQLPVSLQIQQ